MPRPKNMDGADGIGVPCVSAMKERTIAAARMALVIEDRAVEIRSRRCVHGLLGKLRLPIEEIQREIETDLPVLKHIRMLPLSYAKCKDLKTVLNALRERALVVVGANTGVPFLFFTSDFSVR